MGMSWNSKAPLPDGASKSGMARAGEQQGVVTPPQPNMAQIVGSQYSHPGSSQVPGNKPMGGRLFAERAEARKNMYAKFIPPAPYVATQTRPLSSNGGIPSSPNSGMSAPVGFIPKPPPTYRG